MRRIALLAICLSMLIALAGCRQSQVPSDTKQEEIDTTKQVEKTDGEQSIPIIKLSWVNYSENSRIFDNCLNSAIISKTMHLSSVRHLPIFRFDSKSDIDKFVADYADVFSFNVEYNDIPSFNEIISAYDEDYFSEHCLMCVCMTAGSGSFRYGVKDIQIDDSTFCINVEQTNNPEVYTQDMAGWLILVETNKTDIQDCAEYDAQFIGIKPQAEDNTDNEQSTPIREDVCKLYLEVLEDLWNVDSGLNSEITRIGIDLSELSHLTEGEKDTVMSEFASKHNLPYIVGTWEELCEQGFIDKQNLYWEDGLFFSIKTNEDAVWNLPAIKEGDLVPELTAFDAHKWRSGLGAYYFGQCTAQKNTDGKWSYTVGQEAIS